MMVYLQNVPIIFIGHCLGGVLIQEVSISDCHDVNGY